MDAAARPGPYGPFPVLYVLDGGVDQDFHHISGLAQLATIAGAFEVPIVVGLPTVRRATELTSPPIDPRYRRPHEAKVTVTVDDRRASDAH